MRSTLFLIPVNKFIFFIFLPFYSVIILTFFIHDCRSGRDRRNSIRVQSGSSGIRSDRRCTPEEPKGMAGLHDEVSGINLEIGVPNTAGPIVVSDELNFL